VIARKTFNKGGIRKMTGIPITVVLKKLNEQDVDGERHKFHVPEARSTQDDEAVAESDLVKDIEKDFSGEAEAILDMLHLSHLRAKPKNERAIQE
jgi:hypothetical protein